MEISPEYSLKGVMLQLKFQNFGHLMQRTDSLEKTLMLRKTEGREGDNRGWDSFPVHHPFPELAQFHVHRVGDVIQLSHPLSSPSPAFQTFPASWSFLVSQFFTSGGQSIGASASVSVLPMSIQNWFPLGWTGWISLQSKGLSRVFSNTTVQKNQFFGAQLYSWAGRSALPSIHDYWKNHSFD